ncbi:MAG: acyltransferase [Proteobacteria bacterium]|nr:acyltransferase [Pseudomonadota bacterium]
MNKIYFPSLNGLRFIAASLVMIYHVEFLKVRFGLKNYASVPFFNIIGPLGVILFFVLSGFLITYLLLSEQNKTNTISIKDFYIRRILRIWPLYFFIVGISFFVIPKISFFDVGTYLMDIHNNFGKMIILYFALLPNLGFALFGNTLYISQCWSVGVEEQFYLIWPVLMKKIKNKETLFYSIIGGYLFIKVIAFNLVAILFFPDRDPYKPWILFHMTSIDCMAIGGLFALYLFRKDKILTFLFNRTLQFITLIALCTLIGFGIEIPKVNFEVYAVLFGILILNLAGNPKAIISLENKVFNYLGKISYGLYMYQVITIIITLKVLNLLGMNNILLQHISSFAVTIIVAGLSYRFYESYFINMKVKFSKIISGDNAFTAVANMFVKDKRPVPATESDRKI